LNGVQEVTGSSPVAPIIKTGGLLMGEERRKASRVKTSLFVQYCYDCDSQYMSWDITSARDLSESGVKIQTGKSFEIGSGINLRFKMPSRPFDVINVSGTIVACETVGEGPTCIVRIQFKEMSDELKAIFHEYVEWSLKNQVAK
jgi:hypothetical protein